MTNPWQRPTLMAMLCGALLGGCMTTTPQRPTLPAEQAASFARFPAPERGARLYVSMGVIVTTRAINERGLAEGELFVNGQAVDRLHNRGELVVIDLPAGSHALSWLPAESLDRMSATARPVRLPLAEGEVRHVMLDVTVKTGAAAAFGTVAALAGTSYTTDVRVDKHNPRMAERQPARYWNLHK